MKILISGATGLIGKALTIQMMKQGHQVSALVRNPKAVTFMAPSNVFQWSGDQGLPKDAVRNQDAIIHLAGEPVASGRWTSERKKKIYSSRIESTRYLMECIRDLPEAERPKTFICASAIGIYGDRGEEILTEESARGTGFLADVTFDWEKEAEALRDLNIRLVMLRTGIVLDRDGGALPQMKPVVLASGLQWMSWIHLEDEVGFIEYACLNENVLGAYNLVAPESVTNRQFTETLARVTRFPLVTKAPAFVLKAALGEMSQVILASQRVSPVRILNSGYKFKFLDLESALNDLYFEKNYLTHYLSAAQFVPIPIQTVFGFFSKAENLEKITPPFVNFKVSGKSTEEIAEGTLIDYKLKVHGVPVSWQSCIMKWEPNHRFVDDQTKGPYAYWHHEHRFFSVDGGTLLTDLLSYRVPAGLFGKAALGAFIQNDVQTIFNFRQTKIRELVSDGLLK